ncbi:MAG: hypothetical protein MUE97_00810 [Phycisphaerales bacterium]|jgi:preprotein translocase subunit SecA|nr:hypothetical protein [Phycisphaerales bacterium]
MSQALTKYQALYESVRSRARREPAPTGPDRLVADLGVRWRNRQITLPYLRTQAEMIDREAPALRDLGERALDDRIFEIKGAMIRHSDDPAVRRMALAITREVARRLTGESAYLVQLMGALALSHGCICEMLTGEGKTLTGSIAAPLIAWQHRRLHVLTVNDYLAKRDADSRGPIYARCLLDCGSIQQEMDPSQRSMVYARAIVYGTPKQITADYLRDQIALRTASSLWAGRALAGGGAGGTSGGPMVPGLVAALVDEADAVLIDEGVTPLIIAQPRRSDSMARVYQAADTIAAALRPPPSKEHFTLDHVRRKAELTDAGRAAAQGLMEALPAPVDPIWKAPRRAEELIRTALVARYIYQRGKHYDVVEGKIVIVDEYTGRFLQDRSWEHGLHQAAEAKEKLEITADRETLARLSFQRFFRSYPFLCGMTGTAADCTGELQRTYQRKVVVIPTNRPIQRVDMPMRVFATSDARWNAVADEVDRLRRAGRPVLVGTRSIAASEHISRLLSTRGIEHHVLNATVDAQEASIIKMAGESGPRGGAVTVATNMAGRGTDIKPDRTSLDAGGLAVILTEMHGARRVDRQFRGRSGRQGDPGSSRMFVSLQDELLRLYAPHLGKLARAMLASTSASGELAPGPARLAARLFTHAQRRNEARDREQRAEVMRQDDWVEKHLPGQ